jgi:hypothetical protein
LVKTRQRRQECVLRGRSGTWVPLLLQPTWPAVVAPEYP